MKKTKKILAMILSLACMVAVAAGCGDDDSSKATSTSAGDSAAAKEPVTLRTVSMHGGTDPNAGNYKAISDAFVAANDYITLEDDSQTSTQEWKTKVASDFSTGNEPDVIQYFTDANAANVLAADKFVSIDEIKAEYPDYVSGILESAMKAAVNPDGVQRAVPTTGFWEGLFCNKDLFDQYNLELPTDWDKMTKAIEKFKAEGIVPIAVSLNEVPHYWIEFLMLSAAGPDVYGKKLTAVNADMAKGLDMFKTLRDMGAFPADTDTIDNALAGTLFNTKAAAMQLDGSWYAGGLTDKDNTVLCAFPVIPGGKAPAGSMVGGISSGFYITKKAWNDTAKRDAAVKFVMAHTSKASITTYWNGNGQAAAAVDPIAGMSKLGISGLDYSSAATSISSPTDARMTPEAYSTLVAGIVDVSTGAKTGAALLEEAVTLNNK